MMCAIWLGPPKIPMGDPPCNFPLHSLMHVALEFGNHILKLTEIQYRGERVFRECSLPIRKNLFGGHISNR